MLGRLIYFHSQESRRISIDYVFENSGDMGDGISIEFSKVSMIGFFGFLCFKLPGFRVGLFLVLVKGRSCSSDVVPSATSSGVLNISTFLSSRKLLKFFRNT